MAQPVYFTYRYQGRVVRDMFGQPRVTAPAEATLAEEPGNARQRARDSLTDAHLLADSTSIRLEAARAFLNLLRRPDILTAESPSRRAKSARQPASAWVRMIARNQNAAESS